MDRFAPALQQGDHSNLRRCSGFAAGITYSLTGMETDESEYCEATAGSIAISPSDGTWSTTHYVKAPEDTYWHVYTEHPSRRITDEFLIPSIDLEFYCQYRDF